MSFLITTSIIDTISAASSVITYFAGCGIKAFKSSASETVKAQQNPPKWLRYVQIIALVSILALSAAHCVVMSNLRLEGNNATFEATLDASVVRTTFSSLAWLVFVLDLLDQKAACGYEQYIPWTISLIATTANSVISSIQSGVVTLPLIDLGIQWFRVAILVSLVMVTLIFRSPKGAMLEIFCHESANDEERQPLIEHNEDEDDVDYGDDNKSVTSSPSLDPEEDSEEKGQLQELRKRKWWQYLGSFKIFLQFIQPSSWKQYMLLAITILNTALERGVKLGQPLMLGALVADLTKRKFDWTKVVAYVALRFAASSSGVDLIRTLVSFRLTFEMHQNLTYHCYKHIMSLSADYHLNKSSPDVWTIMERGASVIELLNTVFFKVLPVLADLLIALVVVNTLFGPYLCFVVATTMIIFVWANRITLEQKTKRRRMFIEVWRKQFRQMSETLMHWKTVSEFNKIQHETARQKALAQTTKETQISNRAYRVSLEAAQEAVVTVGFLLVCLYAAKQIAEGRGGDDAAAKFVTLVAYWGGIMDPITTLAGSTSDITDKLVDAEKLMLLLEKKPLIVDSPDAEPFLFRGGAVTFENVSFSYDGEREVTKNVSFTVQPGQTVAFVGETGGGKSTMFNLLYRFFDPSSGRILVDGQDIRYLKTESYRSALGLVPQNPVLFNVSIMENVRYSNLQATNRQVIEACKAAELHEKIVKFPKRYKQKVGELAQKLSGGELQRLAIARAILKDPKILLLDEATSAVDSVTESRIQEKLDQLTQGRTTFVIAHRLSTIRSADVIVVVKGGQVVEIGAHDDLLQRQEGAYKELWEAQVKIHNNSKRSIGKGLAIMAGALPTNDVDAALDVSSPRHDEIMGKTKKREDDEVEHVSSNKSNVLTVPCEVYTPPLSGKASPMPSAAVVPESDKDGPIHGDEVEDLNIASGHSALIEEDQEGMATN